MAPLPIMMIIHTMPQRVKSDAWPCLSVLPLSYYHCWNQGDDFSTASSSHVHSWPVCAFQSS